MAKAPSLWEDGNKVVGEPSTQRTRKLCRDCLSCMLAKGDQTRGNALVETGEMGTDAS